MKTPSQVIEKLKCHIKPQWKVAFVASIVFGFLVHFPILVSDIPNHDGLASMYFDQNMITSGRWFLSVACGFSSYFTVPWVIGILGILFLACTAVVLVELLEIKETGVIILISGMLLTFPALASTFAYVFTLDGYMIALFLATLAVLLTKKYRFGFLYGAIALAFSMGTYQAYLPFAVILCVYMILLLLMEKTSVKEKVNKSLKYLYMGIIGTALYYVILRVLLYIQGKQLSAYQGIDNVDKANGESLIETIKKIYTDFIGFSVGGNVLYNNLFSGIAICLMVGLVLFTLLCLVVKRKWWKSPTFFVIMGLLVMGLPIAANLILIISPEVTYHLLMRYQWVLFLILAVHFVSRYRKEAGTSMLLQSWGVIIAAVLLVFNYAVSDNIAYSNLQKRYEKTYAYCVRLLDRIEQTPGYYQGIPIAMIGVVGDEEYPTTDISGKVTSNMIGMGGDSLLYTGTNYQAFMKHYVGATLNILDTEIMGTVYYSPEYREMDSFPGPNSIKIVDGIMYIKTENRE